MRLLFQWQFCSLHFWGRWTCLARASTNTCYQYCSTTSTCHSRAVHAVITMMRVHEYVTGLAKAGKPTKDI